MGSRHDNLKSTGRLKQAHLLVHIIMVSCIPLPILCIMLSILQEDRWIGSGVSTHSWMHH